ncbi:MAG: (Fe-S)-binding protein, partial [Candidatus Bathyarchaeia archaeon]
TAGANPTISVSEKGIKITINDGVRGLSLGRLIGFVSEVDVILLKDFPQSFLSDEKVATIICVRGPEEYERFKEEKEEVIAFCSSIPMNKPVLRLMEDLQIISMKVRKYIERENKVSEILQLLPRLDCGKCGYSTCEEMAVAIYNGESRVEDCFTLRVKSKLKTKVIVNDVEVPIQPFVSEIIRKSVLGMISSLKEVSIKGDETVHIDVSS